MKKERLWNLVGSSFCVMCLLYGLIKTAIEIAVPLVGQLVSIWIDVQTFLVGPGRAAS